MFNILYWVNKGIKNLRTIFIELNYRKHRIKLPARLWRNSISKKGVLMGFFRIVTFQVYTYVTVTVGLINIAFELCYPALLQTAYNFDSVIMDEI